MKRFIVFVGLIAFLFVAYSTHSFLKQSLENQEVIEWANSLVWAAIGSQSSVNFIEPRVTADTQPEHWMVTGEIALRQGAAAPVVHPYAARVAQLCDATDRRECWQLDQLVIGGSEVDLTGLESDYRGAPSQVAADQPAAASADAGSPAGAATAGLEPGSANDGSATGQEGAQQGGTAGLDDAAAPAEPGASEVATLTGESAPETVPEVAPAPAAMGPEATSDGVAALSPQASAQRQMIAEIQARLLDLGYDPGPVDGLMGPQTRTAIEDYQRKNDFSVDGEPSPQLLQLLELQQ
jgi:hypothetical protein